MSASPRQLIRLSVLPERVEPSARPVTLGRQEHGDRLAVPLWAIGAWLFLALSTVTLSFAAAGPAPLPGDAAVLRAIQSLDLGPLMPLAEVTNVIASGPFLIALTLLITFITWRRGHREAAYLMLGATLMRLANMPLKALAESPRPSEHYARVTEDAAGFGFPSGHTMAAVLAFGAIALVVPALTRSRLAARIVQLGAVAGILITGYGRMMTGAHWPSDVLGGICWGVLLLTAAAWLGHWFSVRFDRATSDPAR